MTRPTGTLIKFVAFALVMAVLTAFLFSSGGVFRSSRIPESHEHNNPQKFYLCSTGSSFSYTFTCDPRAADLWLFRSGGGTMFTFQPPTSGLQSPTNNSTAK